jgi:hypothetical protein
MERINIAELLKNCPRGMQLDCTMYDDITLVGVDDMENTIFPIRVLRKDGCSIALTKYGQYADADYAKCVIYPKNKTTWEGFDRPFEDGDVVATTDGRWIGITMGGEKSEFIPTYCIIQCDDKFEAYLDRKGEWMFNRLATKEEKAKLSQAIKDNGYKWNEETKTLEKLPKFKVGDKIVKKKEGIRVPVLITGVGDTYYWSNTENSVGVLPIAEQDDWELVPGKFDITTLKPFESKVLVRDINSDNWIGAFYSHYKLGRYYTIGNSYYCQCIPYEGNEHLLDTSNDCNEYFKNW